MSGLPQHIHVTHRVARGSTWDEHGSVPHALTHHSPIRVHARTHARTSSSTTHAFICTRSLRQPPAHPANIHVHTRCQPLNPHPQLALSQHPSIVCLRRWPPIVMVFSRCDASLGVMGVQGCRERVAQAAPPVSCCCRSLAVARAQLAHPARTRTVDLSGELDWYGQRHRTTAPHCSPPVVSGFVCAQWAER